jgi:hypothetical protein
MRKKSEAALEEIKLAGEGVAGASAARRRPQSGSTAAALAAIAETARVLRGGSGVLLKAGSKLSFAMHYSASGEAGTDQSSIGIVFYPKGATPTRVVNGGFFQKFPAFELDIPPNSKATFDAYMMLPRPSLLTSFQPHMHNRGKAMCMEAIVPTGWHHHQRREGLQLRGSVCLCRR